MHSHRFLIWPIKIFYVTKKGEPKALRRHKWFIKHGIQEGWDGIAMGVYSTVFHFGRLKVKFGNKNFKKKPHKQIRIPIEDR